MYRLGILIAGLVFLLDQSSKVIVVSNLGVYEIITVTSFFNIVFVLNTGISFGIFASGDALTRWILTIFTVAVIILLSCWLYRAKEKNLCVALGMIIGGAIGNVVDRVIRGGVVDFLDFHAMAWHWPAFNVADSAIMIGVGIFFLASLLGRRVTSKLKPNDPR